MNDELTLRDYFAAAALPAILSGMASATSADLSELGHLLNTNSLPEMAARSVYRYADAMLAERAKQPANPQPKEDHASNS